jgi:hypothetical protein
MRNEEVSQGKLVRPTLDHLLIEKAKMLKLKALGGSAGVTNPRYSPPQARP